MFHSVFISYYNTRVFTKGGYRNRTITIVPEVEEWLIEHCRNLWFYKRGCSFGVDGQTWTFYKKEHALLFKLTWGGE